MRDINYFKRSSGQVIVLFALALVALVGILGAVVDIGYQRIQKQKIKLATDAAALAGAKELPNATTARTKALEYCVLNGFTDGQDGVVITTTVDPYGNNPNWFKVDIQKPVNFLFGGLFGMNDSGSASSNVTGNNSYSTRKMDVYSTAEYRTYAPLNITGGGVYGGTLAQMNSILQVKGTSTGFTDGNCVSSLYLADGRTLNPEYNPNGYNFTLYIPSSVATVYGTSQMLLEFYDPDCKTTSGTNVDDGSQNFTTTYTLYAPDQTPNNYNDDVQIAQATVGNTSATNERWISLTNSNSTNFSGNFLFNAATYGYGKYRVNVKTSSGSGTNGFSMRCGPSYTDIAYLSGALNINPNNSAQNEFTLYKPDGTYIDRNTLVAYTGTATQIHVKPKGNSNSNTFALNGTILPLTNSDTYDFIAGTSNMQVRLYQQGTGNGNWWLAVTGNNAEVSANVVVPFNPLNGSSISAVGKLPIRFTRNTVTTITLGDVAREAAGTKLYIKKYDTDIGSQYVTYRCSTLGQTWQGVLAGNGQYKTDEISLPANYNGGTWYADYAAGALDDSVWYMWYSGLTNGETGFVGLVE